MEKKIYLRPEAESITMRVENLMITASPGVDEGGYDPHKPIDTKRGFLDEDDEEEVMVRSNQDLWAE